MSDSTSRRFDQTAGDISPEDLKKAQEALAAEEAKLKEAESVEALKETGKIAHEFMQGMDKVQKVLLILILKFGRASNMLVGVLIGLTIFLTLLIWCLVALYNTQSALDETTKEVRKLQAQQKVIIAKTNESANRARMAEKRAKEAVEASPKIVMDDEGQPKLQVKGDPEVVTTLEEEEPRRASSRTSRTSRTSSGNVYEIPLEF